MPVLAIAAATRSNGRRALEIPAATMLRVFAVAVLTLALLGSGVALADGGQSFQSERAFQRLELQAELEAFYDEQAAKAAGLSDEERLALYREAEAELAGLIVASPVYAGINLRGGMNHLDEARAWLAYRLGLSAVPDSGLPLL